jgi:hypothetical protein
LPVEQFATPNRYLQIAANILDRVSGPPDDPAETALTCAFVGFPYSALGLCKGPYQSVPKVPTGEVFFISTPDKAVRRTTETAEGTAMTETLETPTTHRRVRVWFGAHPIADHTAMAEQAVQYEEAMRRRFASLRVTSEPVLVDAER